MIVSNAATSFLLFNIKFGCYTSSRFLGQAMITLLLSFYLWYRCYFFKSLFGVRSSLRRVGLSVDVIAAEEVVKIEVYTAEELEGIADVDVHTAVEVVGIADVEVNIVVEVEGTTNTEKDTVVEVKGVTDIEANIVVEVERKTDVEVDVGDEVDAVVESSTCRHNLELY